MIGKCLLFVGSHRVFILGGRSSALKESFQVEISETKAFGDSIKKGFLFMSPEGEVVSFSFKLVFDCTNNVAEYSALLI